MSYVQYRKFALNLMEDIRENNALKPAFEFQLSQLEKEYPDWKELLDAELAYANIEGEW